MEIDADGPLQDWYARNYDLSIVRSAGNATTGVACPFLHNGLCVGGVKLDKKDATHTATLDTVALRKSLHAHLTEYGAKVDERISVRPMELRKLSVVAFIQHEDTKKVYQVARIEIGR